MTNDRVYLDTSLKNNIFGNLIGTQSTCSKITFFLQIFPNVFQFAKFFNTI